MQFILNLTEVVWDGRGFVVLSVRNQRPTVSWGHTARLEAGRHLLDSSFSVSLKYLKMQRGP